MDRALSAFYYFRQLGREGLLRGGASPALLRVCVLSLADFIIREPREAVLQLGSSQTWLLSQGELGAFTQGPIRLGPADLATAKANLGRCEVIGLTERMGESLAHLCRVMGWRGRARVEKANVTARRLRVADLDPRTRTLLEELTAADQELYRFGVDLFEQRLAQPPAAPVRPAWLQRERPPVAATSWVRRDLPAQGHAGPKGPVAEAIKGSLDAAEAPARTETASEPR
jgi:hypothetical protein